jgi:uncharacterized membrane protein
MDMDEITKLLKIAILVLFVGLVLVVVFRSNPSSQTASIVKPVESERIAVSVKAQKLCQLRTKANPLADSYHSRMIVEECCLREAAGLPKPATCADYE